MMFSVPQFIDVEDKIAGPLTWKQLGWMIGMGAFVMTIFGIFDTSLSVVLSIPVVLLFCALAFYRPNGISMISFLGSALLFLFRPKVSVWERPTMILPTVKKPVIQNTEVHPTEKHLTREKLAELARMIDSR
ncbi:MAG: PrgI family protein [Candidatus Moraniibacteriota bacterium]